MVFGLFLNIISFLLYLLYNFNILGCLFISLFRVLLLFFSLEMIIIMYLYILFFSILLNSFVMFFDIFLLVDRINIIV